MDLSNQRARTMLRTRTDHLTKVVQTLYLVYIYPPMRRVVLRLPTCAFYQVSSQPGSHRSYHPCHRRYLLGSCCTRSRLLPRSSPSPRPSSRGLLNLNDTLALIFIYSLVGIFALLLLASLAYFALRCLEPPLPDP